MFKYTVYVWFIKTEASNYKLEPPHFFFLAICQTSAIVTSDRFSQTSTQMNLCMLWPLTPLFFTLHAGCPWPQDEPTERGIGLAVGWISNSEAQLTQQLSDP